MYRNYYWIVEGYSTLLLSSKSRVVTGITWCLAIVALYRLFSYLQTLGNTTTFIANLVFDLRTVILSSKALMRQLACLSFLRWRNSATARQPISTQPQQQLNYNNHEAIHTPHHTSPQQHRCIHIADKDSAEPCEQYSPKSEHHTYEHG